MSVVTNYLSAHINTWVSLALETYDQKNPKFLDAAIEVLDQFSLTQGQNAKIVAILQNVPSDNATQSASLMRARIIEVLTGETGAIVQPLLVEEQAVLKTPIVGLSKNYQEEVQGQTNHHLLTNTLCRDVIQHLFTQCISQGDFPCICTLSSLNNHYNQTVNKCWERLNLKQICPQGLTILDLETMGFPGVEPKINPIEVLKAFYEIAPHVEDNAGCTLLTMPQDLTANQLVQIAKDAGITIAARPGCLQEHGDIKIEQAYVVLITNSVFMNSRNKNVDEQKTLLTGYGCEMPTLQEYITVCVLTNKTFKKCLYGQSPWTYGRSSTCLEGGPFIVGASHLTRLAINSATPEDEERFHFDKETCGAGGQRKF